MPLGTCVLASDSSFVPRCYITLDQQRITKGEGIAAKVNIYNFFIRPWNIMWKIYSSASGGRVAQGPEPPANGFVKLGLAKLHGVLNFLLMVLWTSGCKTHSYSFLKVAAGRLLWEEYFCDSVYWEDFYWVFSLMLSYGVYWRQPFTSELKIALWGIDCLRPVLNRLNQSKNTFLC